MTLTEKQNALLQDFEPLDAVVEEVVNSPEFCFSAVHHLYKKMPIEKRTAILQATLGRLDVSFLEPDLIAHEIIRITKEDRPTGLELVAFALRKIRALDLGEHYLCSELGPLNDREIEMVFSAFIESGRATVLFEAGRFLPRICKKNFSSLLNLMRGWIRKAEYPGFVVCLAEEMSKYLYERKAEEAEWASLFELLKEDLASKGITLAKERKNFNNPPQYVEFLVAQYVKTRFDVEKIKANISRHQLIDSILPELREQIEKNNLNHPLVWYLNDERAPAEAKQKMRSLLEAEYAAQGATFSIIELWDLEESLSKLDPQIHGNVRKRLSNFDTYLDTLSELTVSKLLNQIDKFELLPEKDRVDGVLTIGSATINIEIAHPQMDALLRYGHGGGMHPHGKAGVIKDKLPKIRGILNGTETPFVIIFDASSSNLDRHYVENYLFGNETWKYMLNMLSSSKIKNKSPSEIKSVLAF